MAAEQGSTPQTVEPESTPSSDKAVYIVHMDKIEGANANDRHALHLDILSSVLGGSREKAEESLLYSYTNTMTGFSAKLTPEQVAELSTKPGVVQVKRQGEPAKLHGKLDPHTGATKVPLRNTGV